MYLAFFKDYGYTGPFAARRVESSCRRGHLAPEEMVPTLTEAQSHHQSSLPCRSSESVISKPCVVPRLLPRKPSNESGGLQEASRRHDGSPKFHRVLLHKSYIHAYIHTFIPTDRPTYLPTSYVPTDLPAYLSAYLPSCLAAYLPTCPPAHLHACLLSASLPTYLPTHPPTDRPDLPTYQPP